MLLQERQRGDGATLPGDRDWLSGADPMLGHDRGIVAAGRRDEAVAEAGSHDLGSRRIEVDIDAAPPLDEERAQVVDAVGVVGVLVGIEHRIEPIDLGSQQLLAQVGRGIDQDTGDARAIAALDQQ